MNDNSGLGVGTLRHVEVGCEVWSPTHWDHNRDEVGGVVARIEREETDDPDDGYVFFIVRWRYKEPYLYPLRGKDIDLERVVYRSEPAEREAKKLLKWVAGKHDKVDLSWPDLGVRLYAFNRGNLPSAEGRYLADAARRRAAWDAEREASLQ